VEGGGWRVEGGGWRVEEGSQPVGPGVSCGPGTCGRLPSSAVASALRVWSLRFGVGSLSGRQIKWTSNIRGPQI